MAEKKPASKPAEKKAEASKSPHDELQKRVAALEAQMAGMSARLGVNLAEFEQS